MFFPPPRFGQTDEEAFRTEHAQRYALHRRIAVAIALLVNLSFLPWDFLHSLKDADFRISLSLGVTLRLINNLSLLATLLLSLRKTFEDSERYANRVLVFGTICSLGLNGISIYLTGYPYDMLFGVGVFLSIVFTYSVLHLLARTTIALLILSLAYGSLLYLMVYLELPTHASYLEEAHGMVMMQLFQSICFLGLFVGNMAERNERNRFLRERELAGLNSSLLARNQEIGNLVQELNKASVAQTQKTAALVLMKDQLRVAAEMRSREMAMFLASAVHDLKQPLQAIASALEPARMAAERSDRQGTLAMLSLTSSAAGLMREQLGTILELSHLHSSHLKAKITTLDLVQLIEDQLEQLSDYAAQENVQLSIETDGNPTYHCRTDSHFIMRMVNNLISNAIKYRRPQPDAASTVTIRLSRFGERYRIDIVDNGIGIPEEALKDGKIFQPFFQAANNPLREAQRGVGLGLSIVKTMLEMLPNHDILVSSIINQGTTFSLLVPGSDEVFIETQQDSRSALESADNLHGLYALLIEDDDFVRVATKQLLETSGMWCDAYANHAQYTADLAKIERIPSVIISDYRLPDGKTALDILHATRSQLGEIPTVVFTGENINLDDPTLQVFFKVLRKPVSAETLMQTISDAIGASSISHAPPP